LTKETAEELIIKAEKYWFYPKLSRSQGVQFFLFVSMIYFIIAVTNILFDKPAGVSIYHISYPCV